jgi:hypothetical protein
MANTLKKSADSLKAIAAGEKIQEQEELTTFAPNDTRATNTKQKRKTIMIGAHFDPSICQEIAGIVTGRPS